jgi:hypothetical protein
MKGTMVFGALVLSVALASQGFGQNTPGPAGASGCGCCAAPAVCEKVAVKACDPCGCGMAACQSCARRCDLFAGLKDLFACPRCGKVRCSCEPACKACEAPKACAEVACKVCAPAKACCPEPCARVRACAPACVAPKACAPACVVSRACDPVKACAPACCVAPKIACCEKPVGCCEKPCGCGQGCCCARHCREKADCGPNCRPKLGHGLVVSVLDDLFGNRKCAKPACGESACGACGVFGACGGGTVTTTPAKAADAAPIRPAEDVGPLPIPPKTDPSASLIHPRSIYQASRTVAQE